MFSSPELISKTVIYRNKKSTQLELVDKTIHLSRKTDGSYGASDEDILVKISHAAFNPIDIELKNLVLPIFNYWWPNFGLCNDYSGVIVDIGPKASQKYGFKIGDFVCGQTRSGEYTKTLTEYVNFEGKLPGQWSMVKIPSNLSLAEATFALVYSTACGMKNAVKFPQNAKVLVNGASTSVGKYLVSLLKDDPKIKEIVGICSSKSEPVVKSLGVDRIIDYKTTNNIVNSVLEESRDRKFDVFLDCTGSDLLLANLSSFIVKGGYSAHISGGKKVDLKTDSVLSLVTFGIIKNVILSKLGLLPVRVTPVLVEPRDGFEDVTRLFEEGKIKTFVDSVFSFEQYQEAYDLVVSGNTNGKVVVKVNDI